MSREIKFRAWVNEHWVDWLPNSKTLGSYNAVGIYADEYETESECFIEQYIGLEDENGKEIYEGDIIKAQYYDGAQANNRCPAKVVWSDFYLCFVARFKDAREEMPINAGNMEGVKVIGNIHENPELLGGKKKRK